MTQYCYFDGKIKKVKDIYISPYDLGFMRGYAVFDVARTKTDSSEIFMLDEHYKRIKKSAKSINVNIDFSKDDFAKTIQKLLKKNNQKTASIRTIVTGGVSKDGFTFSGKGSVLILIEKLVMPTKDNFEKGVTVATLDFKRELPEVKTTNYLEAIKYQKLKTKFKAYEILYFKDNLVYEASTANVFIVKKGKVYTPKNGVLPGTTKLKVLDLAKKNKIEIIEKDIKVSELKKADEVFLTATNKNIVPVIKIDSTKVNKGEVGDVTKRIIDIFHNFENTY